VTVNEDVLAAVTVAWTAPKKTMSFAGTSLKLFPLMTTLEPAVAEAGLKESEPAMELDSMQPKTKTTAEIIRRHLKFLISHSIVDCRPVQK